MVMISLDAKHELIRRQEEILAFDMAKQVIEKPKASIWIIFMPIFFVFQAQKIQKYKKSVREFAKGFMHTKLLALDAALDEARTGKLSSSYKEAAGDGSAYRPENAQIRNKQILEIGVLKEHYLLLLRSQGETYPELLRNAYTTAGAYLFFLNRLLKAEEEVNKAVIDSHHSTPEAREVVVRMEKVADKLREKEMREVFP